ncbi:serine/threonine-protein kinase [Streptomyces montanisoli]|uniref:non-specific serine/threonine protein kinase n=1 Tax=Streptomyces montanisoli TaxID=2798581 RepID=A0A940M607_9ACTN|nr:serine/threonine-protein kinase [Streptomyces montanisoli]MBP0456794.1 serine/threonine protein kinase [Streptomyces montanisoli]
MSPPELIGRYRIERRLGTGAFGVVWLAHDDRLDAPVAVKVMADNWAYRMDVRERFLAEARLLRKGMSSGVVKVFDVGELPDERPYFVMEYADRGTLEDRLTAGVPGLAESLSLVAGAARGAGDLHEAGIVHRDIKPSNVLLAGGGEGGEGQERVLLADLGLAKNLAQASGLTVVAGSAGYMAPEQAEPFDGIDARADVYSLGAVLYHLVTGVVPGPPGKVLPPAKVRPGVPKAVQRAVQRAMEPDRERRWPTAAAFADELDRLATQAAGGRVRRRPAIRVRRRTVVISVAALVVALGGGSAAAALLRQDGEPRTERVADRTGQVSVEVPRAWARQVVDSGWSPADLGLKGGHEPGLTVAGNVRDWRDLGSGVSGVFVGAYAGAAKDLAAKAAAAHHATCTYAGSRAFSDGSWHGTVRTWRACGASGNSLDEVALAPAGGQAPEAYVQVRYGSGTGGTATTDRILRSLHVTA